MQTPRGARFYKRKKSMASWGLGTTSACIPTDVMRRVVVNYLEARPNGLHERFSLLALADRS